MSEADNQAGTEPMTLTPTERRLLDALCRHPGRIFSRKELLALAIPDAVVLERTIDVHIQALRRKLGAAHRIHTIRRRGYVWK